MVVIRLETTHVSQSFRLPALSEDSKSKILALDGISVVMETLEAYQDANDVQQAALGAFHELALEA